MRRGDYLSGQSLGMAVNPKGWPQHAQLEGVTINKVGNALGMVSLRMAAMRENRACNKRKHDVNDRHTTGALNQQAAAQGTISPGQKLPACHKRAKKEQSVQSESML